MAAGPVAERNQDATVYIGSLDEQVTESLLWEMFIQAGPIVNVHMPKDRVTQTHLGYGFVEFMREEDANYAIQIMNMSKLYGKTIRVSKANPHQKNLDVGANIFIGNLDPEVDEKLLYDTFSGFGDILQTPKIMRDPETGKSKGIAFIHFASFQASDASIQAMDSQYLGNRKICVSYAFKKDGTGERHGCAAERLLAAQNSIYQADAPPVAPQNSPNIPAGHRVTQHLQYYPMHRGMVVPPSPSSFPSGQAIGQSQPPPAALPSNSSFSPANVPPPPLPHMPMNVQPSLPPISTSQRSTTKMTTAPPSHWILPGSSQGQLSSLQYAQFQPQSEPIPPAPRTWRSPQPPQPPPPVQQSGSAPRSLPPFGASFPSKRLLPPPPPYDNNQYQ